MSTYKMLPSSQRCKSDVPSILYFDETFTAIRWPMMPMLPPPPSRLPSARHARDDNRFTTTSNIFMLCAQHHVACALNRRSRRNIRHFLLPSSFFFPSSFSFFFGKRQRPRRQRGAGARARAARRAARDRDAQRASPYEMSRRRRSRNGGGRHDIGAGHDIDARAAARARRSSAFPSLRTAPDATSAVGVLRMQDGTHRSCRRQQFLVGDDFFRHDISFILPRRRRLKLTTHHRHATQKGDAQLVHAIRSLINVINA